MSRFRTLILASSALYCAALTTAMAQSGSFDIAAGPAGQAVQEFAQQAGLQIIVREADVRGLHVNKVKGEFETREGLRELLRGTNLKIASDDGRTIILTAKSQTPQKSTRTEITPLQLAQASPSSGRIEEVLVTARKREEAVENIPISITALSAEDLKTFGIRNFADLEGVVPGLSMGGGGNGVKKDSNPFIRGVGQRETKVTLDPAVATYIDGIYIGRAAGAMLDVVDVDNIQVLRGPQGTLFGRNATGGALSVSLKKPNNDWEAQVSANIGNYGRRDLTGIVNIPFVEDKVMGRFMVASINSNGYFTNIVDNTKWGDDNRVTGIAQLRILPTDRITIDLLGERTRIRETPRPQKCAFLKPTGYFTAQTFFMNGLGLQIDGLNRFEAKCRQSEALPQSQFASDMAANPPVGGRVENDLYYMTPLDPWDPTGPSFRTDATLYQPTLPRGRYWVDTATLGGTIGWELGEVGPFSDASAKSITAWRKTKQIADEDLDAVGSMYLLRIQPSFDETTQFSQEVQLSGKALNDRLFLSIGGFYFKEKTPQNDLILSAGMRQDDRFGYISLTAFEPALERLQTDNHSWAWFAQADFELTPEIEVTGGIRWTTETRWSRYSKATVEPNSVPTSPITSLNPPNQAGGTLAFQTNAFGLNPVMDWRFGSYAFTKEIIPTGSQRGSERVVQTFTPGAMIGDELSKTDSAWTPMFSLKYKANDNVLQALGLDQAMLYATYSQGFHSGGVTSGALDTDRGPEFTQRPATVANPCADRTTGQCRTYTYIPTLADGFGTADPITFEPEKVVNYEVGFKAAGLDRRIQANIAAFYMDYTDMQVTAVGDRAGIPVPYIQNVGASVIKGIELEVVALPTPQWRILMNGSYTDADIKEWVSPIAAISGTTFLPTGEIYYIDRSDERLPRVPRWQFFASSEYNFRLPGGGSITPSVGVRFTSSIYHGFDRGSWTFSNGGRYYNNNGYLPPDFGHDDWWMDPSQGYEGNWPTDPASLGYDPVVAPAPGDKWKTTSRPTAFLDARLAWISEDGKMEAALWGKNLFNTDDYLVGGIPLADVNGGVGQVFANPRTFGLTFTYHFGE